jgi:hypothetical protein
MQDDAEAASKGNGGGTDYLKTDAFKFENQA